MNRSGSLLTCRQVLEMLLDFLNGELTPEHLDSIRQHLAACPPCGIYMETYQITIRLSRQLPPSPLPAALTEKLHKMLEEIEKI